MEAKFILSKNKLLEQVEKLKSIGLNISYSYKTNNLVGDVLQDLDEEILYSIHSFSEIDKIKNKEKIQFFSQAESIEEFKEILEKGILSFVIDNEIDLENLLKAVEIKKIKINIGLRMKFQEHRIGSGKYFVYGMPSEKVNELLSNLKENKDIEKLGVHIHRKTQNTSEWEIISEIEDSLSKENLSKLDFINLGGGLPSIYRSSNEKVFEYIFQKLENTVNWFRKKNINCFIEPGRFLAAPCVKLCTKVIQKNKRILTINTSLYNCALDTLLTGTKMLVEGELKDSEKGEYYLIKGNSPTRDDIFRYKVKLKNLKVGDRIIFLNAGAYNYATDFFGYIKLNTEIVDDFP